MSDSGLPHIWALAVSAALLLWPAIYNGFPLVFPDTGAYFSVAWSNTWTLDRSGFYGFFFRSLSSLHAVVQLWFGLVIQALAVAAIVLLVMRQVLPTSSAMLRIGVVAIMAGFTSVGWHTSQLMPDAFSAAAVLLVWLACARAPTAPGAPLLWFGVFLVALMHYTHVALVLAAGAATLLVLCAAKRVEWQACTTRALTCGLVAVAVVATQIIANGAFINRWSPAPLGSMFLFARLHEDGLIQPWLEENCASGATPSLCSSAHEFPSDSQKLLWGRDPPLRPLVLDASGRNSNETFVAELQKASLGAIAAKPAAFAESLIRGGAKQFVSFHLLDDECPEVCREKSSAVYGWFRDYRPSALDRMLESRQLQGTIPKPFLRAVASPPAVVSLLLLPLLLYFTWRRRDVTSSSLLASVLVALVANSLVTGGLSDVHDRYQSRIVWLAPFTVIVILLRLYWAPRSVSPPKAAGV